MDDKAIGLAAARLLKQRKKALADGDAETVADIDAVLQGDVVQQARDLAVVRYAAARD